MKRFWPINNLRWITAAFCLLTMLSAVVVSTAGHNWTESAKEIIEFEEAEEAVTARRTHHKKCEQVAFVRKPTSRSVIRNIYVVFRGKTERDRFNGMGGFLTT